MRRKTSSVASSSVLLMGFLLSLVLLLSACHGPKVLNQRGEVPSPTLKPYESGEQQIEEPVGAHAQLPVVGESIKPVEVEQISHVTSEPIKYTVKKGDSFWRIAKMYGVSMKELAAYNKMDLNKKLKYGTVLDIPPGGLATPKTDIIKKSGKTTSSKIAKQSLLKSGTSYTVKRGDSLWIVAKRSGVTVSALAAANGLSSNSYLKVGQKLVIPKGTKKSIATTTSKKVTTERKAVAKQQPVAIKENNKNIVLSNDDKKLLDGITEENAKAGTQTTTLAAPSYLPHTVKEGDSWETVSDMYGVSVNDLKKANPKIASDSTLKVGSVVNIPEE